jgi:hypothetical protein
LPSPSIVQLCKISKTFSTQLPQTIHCATFQRYYNILHKLGQWERQGFKTLAIWGSDKVLSIKI